MLPRAETGTAGPRTGCDRFDCVTAHTSAPRVPSSTISSSALRRNSPETRSAVLASPKSQPRTACSAIWIGASQAARSASVTLSASCDAQWKVRRMSAIVGFSRAFTETLEQDWQQNERQQGGGDKDRKSKSL